jgi:protein-S-isoprenylcysteine O-methyltransferase Ste14
MDSAAESFVTNKPVGLDADGRRGVIRELLRPVFLLSILLVSAGTFAWINAWIFCGMFLSFQIAYLGTMLRVNPQLLNYRSKMQQGTQGFDKIFFIVYIPLMLTAAIVSGFDAVRYQWATMTPGVSLLGGFVYFMMYALVLWAMLSNIHFEATVRIQNDRDHHVCSSGPYRFVRHPGYVGMLFGGISMPLMLGSWWGLVPAGICGILAIVRTALEDRFLQRELAGYQEYARHTRYRLIPLVW